MPPVYGTLTAKNDIDKIEKIQRRAARFVLHRYKKTDSVSSMLKELNWETLEHRRKKAISISISISNDLNNLGDNNKLQF